MEELAGDVNFLSDYLEHQRGRNILTQDEYTRYKITQDEYTRYKITLSEKIKKTKDNCECNIKGVQSRISYVGPR
jgi:hypothetical protein